MEILNYKSPADVSGYICIICGKQVEFGSYWIGDGGKVAVCSDCAPELTAGLMADGISAALTRRRSKDWEVVNYYISLAGGKFWRALAIAFSRKA